MPVVGSADGIAAITNYANQLGIASALPKGWQNSDAAYDAATKIITKEGFDQLQASGLTRAPASGFREVNMTIPRPDMAPAARQLVIGDTIAQLQYQHDLINGVAASGDHNVLRAMNQFQQQNSFGDYVKRAQQGMPQGRDVTPAAARMVGLPPQQGSASQSGSPSTGGIPAAGNRVAGQTYMTPKGPARWMGNGWSLVGSN